MNLPNLLGSAFVAAVLTLSAQAATVTFTLNQDACSGTCGTGPFATVTINDNGTGSSAFVTVTETLSAAEKYAATGAGDALAFNVAGVVTIGNEPSHFGVGADNSRASAFGTFYHAVTCLACQGGNASNPSGPLSFTVSSSTGVTTASFTNNSGGYYFASDIVGTNGNTGNVGSFSGTVALVPEPGSIILLLTGSLLLIPETFRAARASKRSCTPKNS